MEDYCTSQHLWLEARENNSVQFMRKINSLECYGGDNRTNRRLYIIPGVEGQGLGQLRMCISNRMTYGLLRKMRICYVQSYPSAQGPNSKESICTPQLMPQVCLSASRGGLLHKSSVCAQWRRAAPSKQNQNAQNQKKEVDDGQAETNNGANLIL